MVDVIDRATPQTASHLPPGAARLHKLDAKQVGTLRHIGNLAHRLDGDWAHMGGIEAGQENVTAFRYQLAWMAYALGVAHFHRLPGAPGAFKQAYAHLMRKMLRYDVWSYWEHTSKSGQFMDPGITQLRESWRDPVVKENIMYSGHVHAMAGMFGVLFDDDRYEKEGGLTFSFNPVFSSGAENYVYDLSSLNEVIYWQMVESGFLGIACEPNMVFLSCNQFPMLGFRFHDVRKGTSFAGEVTQAHEAAWKRKGWMTDDDFFAFYFIRQDAIVGASNSYTAALMNAWNPDFIHGLYPRQLEGFFDEPEPGMIVPSPRALTGERLDRYDKPDSAVGLAAVWLSEMGDAERLTKLLRYADTYLEPTWERGGLFYPRRDELYDEDGRFVNVDPWVGNALIGFSRLNVPDGIHRLYAQPWTAEHFREPNLSFISPYCDVLRAGYLSDEQALVVTAKADDGARGKPARLSFANIRQGSGEWRLERDGIVIATSADVPASDDRRMIDENGDLTIIAKLEPVETDFVLWTNR